MIVQSPESAMPEPYKTYVRQRSENITEVLRDVVGDADVQLCPRAITQGEQLFSHPYSHVYGVIVEDIQDGHKSVLYSDGFEGKGIATEDPQEAIGYVEEQVKAGNRVRVKDPRESDGHGQHSVSSVEELLPVFHEIVDDSDAGCVLMPHLNQIHHRVSVGQLSLEGLGRFYYVGREETTSHNGSEVYGGTTLGFFSDTHPEYQAEVEDRLDIPPQLARMGRAALEAYSERALFAGRASVDVVEGRTDNGEIFRDVIDVTPRIGGTTPAEVLALREVYRRPGALCLASSKLIYDPPLPPANGMNFIETDELVINARVHEVTH